MIIIHRLLSFYRNLLLSVWTFSSLIVLISKYLNIIMTITYIYHSCYLVEFEEYSMLFDFYEDAPRISNTNWVKDYLLSKDEDLYVFCTHSHADHFNPEILSWREKKSNIRYIFSEELLQSKKVKEDYMSLIITFKHCC